MINIPVFLPRSHRSHARSFLPFLLEFSVAFAVLMAYIFCGWGSGSFFPYDLAKHHMSSYYLLSRTARNNGSKGSLASPC